MFCTINAKKTVLLLTEIENYLPFSKDKFEIRLDLIWK